MNANAVELENMLASPDFGYWNELPLPMNIWHAGAAGSAIGNLTDAGATMTRAGSIGAVGGIAANGAAQTVFIACSVPIPQLKMGTATLLQTLNAAASGDGPFVEVLLLARGRAGSGNEDLEVDLTWLDDYAADAAWVSLTNKQVSPALANNAAALPTSFRWVNVPLLRPNITPVATPPHTAALRDNLNTDFRSNNFPLLATLRVQNSTALAANEFIDIAGAVLRFRAHLGSRNQARISQVGGFTNGGVIAVAPADTGSTTF